MWSVGGSDGEVRREKGRRKAPAAGKVKTRVRRPGPEVKPVETTGQKSH
jgi:hypothetical protein